MLEQPQNRGLLAVKTVATLSVLATPRRRPLSSAKRALTLHTLRTVPQNPSLISLYPVLVSHAKSLYAPVAGNTWISRAGRRDRTCRRRNSTCNFAGAARGLASTLGRKVLSWGTDFCSIYGALYPAADGFCTSAHCPLALSWPAVGAGLRTAFHSLTVSLLQHL